jgi:hypothetical protein
MKKIFTICLLFFLSLTVHGQDSFPNTITYNDSIGSPEATLNDLSWVSGYWKGKAFGGIIEEVWTPNLGGSMMCAFKLIVEGKVKFYELVTISEENKTLILRLKHFHQDLKGWETKDETIDFELVKVTKDKVFFDEFTFEKEGEDKMNIYVVIQNGNQKNEVKFSYSREEI